MAVKLSDFGATVTAGKGRAKTVILEVDFTELRAWAKRMKVKEAAIWRKAYKGAIRVLKSKFQKVISNAGGVEGVPKFRDFEQFTKELRVAGNFSGKPMGGVLADKRRIVSYPLNGWRYIGWPDALAKWSVKFQDGAGEKGYDPFTDAKRRARWHALGIMDIPAQYIHNPRQVLPDPFVGYVDKYLDQWTERVFLKELANLMAKGAA